MSAITRRAPRLGVLVAAFILAVGLVLSATPASAHGGPYELSVSSDGAGGLTVLGHYGEDDHVVNEIMDPVATATSTDGRTVGPVALVSSPEGEGVWVTAEPFIPTGDWTVTVTTTVPSAVSTTAEMTVTELTAPRESTSGADAEPEAPGLTTWLWVVAGAVALGLALLWLFLARARQPRSPRPRAGGAAGGTPPRAEI
ncbi:hypothetical protein [Glaciibacter psychrotolerans]|uniref:Uncharacterized protein n=1 Tax=Glaciibacter psychrotolerans TaxID=670054 RepID=A0A7Z0EI77_9MICO|nr:hypothetical protein [Leifsonia psychrotolerans]NYJ21332.1 hypothetical protein [Leifsonia psychrotolerans]